MLTAARPTPVAATPLTAGATTHRPTALELAADQDDLAVIRDLFGSRAQTLINALLSFDGFFAWYFNLKKSVDHNAELSVKEAHALENCRTAIDMHEIYERAAIRKHGSFMVHGAIYKTSRDIIRVGDVWRYCVSALELQNAETKRVAKSGGSCRQQFSTACAHDGVISEMTPLAVSPLQPSGMQRRNASPHCASSWARQCCAEATGSLPCQSAAGKSVCLRSAAPNWPQNGSNRRS